MRKAIFLFTLFSGCFFFAQNLVADIYKYVDEMGVTHLTNTPTSSRFKVLIRTDTVPYRERKYDYIINALCAKYNVQPAIIKAIIKTESDFDPYAVSRKGARGLMQLMPQKASDLSVEDSFDPRQNLDGGIRHVCYLLKKYKGDVKLALAAYNAGETAVEKNNGVPPFVETRNYIRKVLRFRDRYR